MSVIDKFISDLNSNASQKKRIESMYKIIQNDVYAHKYTTKERICAAELIVEILKGKQ